MTYFHFRFSLATTDNESRSLKTINEDSSLLECYQLRLYDIHYTCWAHSVDRDDRRITVRRYVDRHSARHLIDMRNVLSRQINVRNITMMLQ